MQEKELFDHLVPQQIGNYKFKNPLLLKQAFTRKSYTEENGGQNNEVLEFIGDKVLDICVIRYLVKRYGTDLHAQDGFFKVLGAPEPPKVFESELDEGDLTRLKQRMVEKKALARRIDELDLSRFLIMGQGDVEKHIEEEPSVREDLFEAIIGAVALDSNWDFEKLQEVVEVMLNPGSFIDDPEEPDYVGLIYEWDARYGIVPWFKYSDGGESLSWYVAEPNVIYSYPQRERGPYKHTCQVKLCDDLPVFESYGISKDEARKEACKAAYEYLEKNGKLPGIRDEIDNPNIDDSINQLEILSRRGYFSIPEYDNTESYDDNGNPIWTVECSIEEIDGSFVGQASSKKTAKKQAAYKVLMRVLNDD